jgi:hypothetical protein
LNQAMSLAASLAASILASELPTAACEVRGPGP